MVVSIRMSEEEKKIAKSYAEVKGMTLSEAMKKVYFEAIEDEFDISLADKALAEYSKDNKSIPLKEVEKILGI
jgi:predicted DNA-binding protein